MTLLHRLASIVRWMRPSRPGRARAGRRAAGVRRAVGRRQDARRRAAGRGAPAGRARARRRRAGEGAGPHRSARRRGSTRSGATCATPCRMFARNRGFTVVVVLTLALGIGANTAIFSLIDALMLRWLPVRNPQELVQVALRRRTRQSRAGESFSYADRPRARRAAARSSPASAGFSGLGLRRRRARHRSAACRRRSSPAAYYETLGLTPAAGRLLDARRRRARRAAGGGDQRRLLGAAVRARARRPSARRCSINGVPVTIVGVSPRGFVGANVGAVADITMPVAALAAASVPEAAPLLGPGNFWLRVLARPRRGHLDRAGRGATRRASGRRSPTP